MRRGDLITVYMAGDLGKPRPALVIQSDRFDATSSLTVLPLSSTLIEAPLLRLTVQPTEGNRLRRPSQVMIDKPITVRREKIGSPFGRLADEDMLAVNRLLASFLGFG